MNGTQPSALALLLGLLTQNSVAQDRLKAMPGYERYQKVSREMTNIKLGVLSVTWTNEGKAFEYRKDGKRYRYDIAARRTEFLPAPAEESRQADESRRGEGRRQTRDRSGRVARGRQFTSAISPDGKFKAFYRDRNLWLSDTNDANEKAITTDGHDKTRLKYGTASWVYGEELFQNTAMWWSTNSQKIAFYRFDERSVPDYYLALNQTKIQSTLDVEPYTKAGVTNPTVDLLIYDVGTTKTVQVDVRDGKPFDDSVIGHYIYRISWSRDDQALLFHRTNRRQNIMELCAADPATGHCRVLLREEWPASWTENLPALHFLKDGKRFVWASERTGWKNLYLYDLSGRLLTTLTQHSFEVADVVHVDEEGARLYYTAHDGDNPLKLQLHRVGLDGRGHRRLTDPAYHHSVDVAPDGQHFIDVAQTHDSPPVTSLRNVEGHWVDELASSDMRKSKQLDLKPVELFQFKAADGATDLYGMLHFPSNFKPFKKYPLLVNVYAGPATTGARETFGLPNSLTEYGFLVATLDSRSASGRGKRFLDDIYLKLGTVEIDDQAAGVKSLGERRYVDRKRVGIFGLSYGGYASLMGLLRHPEVFQAAAASCPPTAWYHYDSIYTERYMGLPQENKAGYEAGNAMNYADKLKGRLLIYYGTADDNVHPSNALQLIQALQRAGKSFEVQVGPDLGHGSVNRDRMMEFFIENLVLK